MVRCLLIFMALIGVVLATGCEDKKQADLFNAQICIDNATAANVNNCLTEIEGDNSKRAAVLRCSAAFISQNIDEVAIVNALENIDGEEGGNPTTPAIAALAMEDTTVSAAAVATCDQAQSEALSSLANFANLATAMKQLLGFADGASAADIEALIDGYTHTPNADTTALGQAVITSQSSLCNADNGLFKDDEACVDINAAIAAGGGDPDAVANALIQNLDETP